MKSLAALTKKGLGLVLTLAMALTLLPAAVLAEDSSHGDLELGKTVVLEDDGTYTINLEAYATGEIIHTVSTTPTDIVLLLDVSGSMDDGTLTVTTDETFVYTEAKVKDGPDLELYHKCPDGTYSTVWWEVSWLGTTYRYHCNHCGASRKWTIPGNNKIPHDNDSWELYEKKNTTTMSCTEALKYAVDNFIDAVAEKNALLTDPAQRHRISVVKFAGTESTSVGNDTYKDNSYTYNYTQIVKNLTTVDAAGATELKAAVDALQAGGATSVDYGMNRAEAALAESSADRNKVIVLFSDGSPTHGSSFDTDVANDAIAKAYQQKQQNVVMYSIAVMDGADPSNTSTNVNKFFHAMSSNYPNAWSLDSMGSGANEGYYKTAANADELHDIFEEISDNVSSTTVTLDSNAVLKDIVADEFTIPQGATVSAATVDYTGRDVSGNRTWAAENTPLPESNITVSGNTVSVTGFDYKTNCLVDEWNPSTEKVEGSGKKLVVTIKGVEAMDAAATGENIYTNKETSGIYASETAKDPVAAFNRPVTKVNSELYVLDYAKPAVLADADQDTRISLNADGMHRFTTATTEITEQYGKAAIEQNITYTPTTTNWDGYDTFYSFGKVSGNNIWSKISVLPANNVYYEDDFITSEDSGTVGIEYTGEWTVDKVSAGNTETANNDVHGGWQNADLADDTQYSDGSAHSSTASSATASFTFTGTGVDVYSRTNNDTLTVLARLNGTSDSGETVAKTLIMNNQSVSGDYYQIPTLSFAELEHGTYTVTITVTGSTGIYYLDGIRVYNPIQDLEEDETVQEGYGPNELGAVFTEVRNLLLDSGKLTADAQAANGVVFIDKTVDETGSATDVIGTYKDYGPKNEVYLAKGQAIAFAVETPVDTLNHYYIGLKVPTGSETSVSLTNGNSTSDVTVGHSTDLYYEITPNENGLFVIRNTGDSLLSITKLRTNCEAPVGEVSLQELWSYMEVMDTLPVVEYAPDETEQPDDSTGPETGDDGANEGGNVDIENPDNGQNGGTPTFGNAFKDFLKKIFDAFNRLF